MKWKESIGVVLLATRGLSAAGSDKVTAGAPSADFITINYDGQSIPDPIDGVLRYNTVIQLPKGELVREVAGGSVATEGKPGSGDWIVTASTDNDAVYVRPTRPGVATNLEIATDHNNRYKLLLQDRSQSDGYHPHLQYQIAPLKEDIKQQIAAPAKWVLASEYEQAKADRDRYRTELAESEKKWQVLFQEDGKKARGETLAALKCDYQIQKAAQAPFHVSQVCTDGNFTYVWAPRAADHFGITDLKQGAESIINPDYDPKSSMYTIHHVIDRGRVQIGSGKKTVSAEFSRPGV
jgi:hypothetical protein